MKKFNEASYRTPCGEAGYIVRFEDGTAVLIVAYHGLYGDCCKGECEACRDAKHCPIMEYNFEYEQHVCGWDEADELLELWGYDFQDHNHTNHELAELLEFCATEEE